MVSRRAVNRARVVRVVFRRAVYERVRVPSGGLYMKEVTAVEDGGSVDLACEITDLAQLVEHGGGPVVGS